MPSYRPQVLDGLAAFGIVPKDDTDPARARELLSDIYCYELRRLRARLLRHEIEKASYADHVLVLRKKYFLLSIPVTHWTE